MRLSDLLEHPVVDQDGAFLGVVHDVHLLQDGALQANGQAALRAHGLIVGRGSFGTRLGFATGEGRTERGSVHGPAPLRWLVGRLDRSARYVPWAAVVTIDEHQVVVDRAEVSR